MRTSRTAQSPRRRRHDRVIEIGPGSRLRSGGKKTSPPTTPDSRTDRHRLDVSGSNAERLPARKKAAGSSPASRSKILEGQWQKARRLAREIESLLERDCSTPLNADGLAKLNELRLELNLTNDVIHQYELQLKAAS